LLKTSTSIRSRVRSFQIVRLLAHDCDLVHDNGSDGAIVRAVDRCIADGFHNIHAFDDFAEYGVPVIEMFLRAEGYEELTAVRVFTGVRHRENAFFAVT